MKAILKTIACGSALLLMTSAFAACSPNDSDNEPVTTTTQTTTTVATTTTNHGVLSASDVIVRSGPGLDYDAIGGITYNEEVIILGKEGDWYRIQFGDQIGYISAQYVDTDDAPNASEMVEDLKTTATVRTTTKATTTKAGGKTTTTKAGDNSASTTTTKAGDKTASTTKSTAATGNTTTTTGTGAVTTSTTVYTIPTVKDGIPQIDVVDDF